MIFEVLLIYLSLFLTLIQVIINHYPRFISIIFNHIQINITYKDINPGHHMREKVFLIIILM